MPTTDFLNRKPIVITSGEPAGIGPDLVLALANEDVAYPFVVCANIEMLKARAKQLALNIEFKPYNSPEQKITSPQKGHLWVCDSALTERVDTGVLNKANSPYVLNMLHYAATSCMKGEFSALVTAPVHKGIINEAGIAFTGHTEFLAQCAGVDDVVMMLATDGLSVALATTHIPLAKVSQAITKETLTKVITILNQELKCKFGIKKPHIYVCGLNPHAGEGGALGREEIEVITPCLETLRHQGIHLTGPLPADTLFQDKYLNNADAVLAMYHDQGLPVLKFKGFGRSVNITLGLPFIRTSVDHGTALDLAGTGTADLGSLRTALSHAIKLVDKKT